MKAPGGGWELSWAVATRAAGLRFMPLMPVGSAPCAWDTSPHCRIGTNPKQTAWLSLPYRRPQSYAFSVVALSVMLKLVFQFFL